VTFIDVILPKPSDNYL